MLGAWTARAVRLGFMVEHPGSLEVAVLRGTQPYGQDQKSSKNLSESRHEVKQGEKTVESTTRCDEAVTGAT